MVLWRDRSIALGVQAMVPWSDCSTAQVVVLERSLENVAGVADTDTPEEEQESGPEYKNPGGTVEAGRQLEDIAVVGTDSLSEELESVHEYEIHGEKVAVERKLEDAADAHIVLEEQESVPEYESCDEMVEVER